MVLVIREYITDIGRNFTFLDVRFLKTSDATTPDITIEQVLSVLPSINANYIEVNKGCLIRGFFPRFVRLFFPTNSIYTLTIPTRPTQELINNLRSSELVVAWEFEGERHFHNRLKIYGF